MKVKSIEILEEIIDLELDSLDVLVKCEDGYTYVVVVTTPVDLADEMAQEKMNYLKPQGPKIIVKKLTKQIIEEAILAYAENDAYWLKLCHFGHLIDISVLNQVQEDLKFEQEG